MQKDIDECVYAFEHPTYYSPADIPDWCLKSEYEILSKLKSEKADADWLKAHKLPDSYRMKNKKTLKYGYCHSCKKSRYEITNSFELNENNEELLPILIRSETIDINMVDEEGDTLMHRYGSNPEIVKALIEKGADLTLKNNDGTCAFYGIGNLLLRELILSGLDTSKVINSDGSTVLHNYANNIEMAKALIKNGADVHQKNKEGRTPIFYAWNVDAFKLLLENGADIKAVDNHHNTLLHAALNPEVLSFLHGQGLDVNAKNDDGQTPILFAESADTLKWYIDHGADVKVIDKHGNSLLHSKTFNPEMRGMMLNYNLDINAKNDEGQTPLFFIDLNDTDLLSAYINAGADINARDKHGNTIVHYQFAPQDSWELLVQSGFNINTKNHRKEPAWFARYKQECLEFSDNRERMSADNEEDILGAYLDLGADVKVQDKHGDTLLHRTLKCGKKDNKDIDCYDESLQFSESRIRKLIKAGIDVNARNEDGYTPIFSCIYHEGSSDPDQLDKDCVNLFIELGADIHAAANKGDNLFTECIHKGCGDYDLIFKNQLHKNLSEMTIQRALEVYKKAVFDRDESCRKWEIYDSFSNTVEYYCRAYEADRQLLPLMMDFGLDLKDGYMCIFGVPKVDSDDQKHKIADVINEKICGKGCTAFNQRNWDMGNIGNFIRSGADINTQDDEGKTPLMKNGIDFDGTDFGPVDCIHVDKITQFVESGADINLRDNNGNTILNYVMDLDEEYCRGTSCADGEKCNVDIVSYLIKKGADVHNRNFMGKTFLMYALDMGNDKYIKQLIHKGADVNAKDNDGKSVLAYAADRNEDIIKLLIRKGADVNAKNKKGKSVLAYAAAACNEKLIKQLIAKGADVNAKNNDGESVLDYAEQCSDEIKELLKEKGATAENDAK